MDYGYGYSGADAAAAGIGFMVLMVPMLIGLAILAVTLFFQWKIYVKAGKPGWAAIVPIYNWYVLTEIVGRPAYWAFAFVLSFIPIVGSVAFLVVTVILQIDLAKSFGKETGFGLGLAFLSPIFAGMLALGDAQYQGPSVDPATAANPFAQQPQPGAPVAPVQYAPPAQPVAPAPAPAPASVAPEPAPAPAPTEPPAPPAA